MTTMKGILKGLRYISQIFDNEKEEEMQIGYPTDVKHVAHIGADGPSANTPSWMNEYKPNSEGSSVPSNSEPKGGKAATKKSSGGPLPTDVTDGQNPSGAPLDSPTRRHSSKSKHSRRHHSSGESVVSLGSPTQDPSESNNKPRRHKNSGDLDSPTRDSPGRARRIQNSILGSESLSQGQPRIPRHSRQKKTKGTTGGGSSSRSKGLDHSNQNFPYSDPGPGPG